MNNKMTRTQPSSNPAIGACRRPLSSPVLNWNELILGEDVTGKPPHAITARGIGRTFQNIRLFQNMSAIENVMVGMHTRMKANLFNSIIRTPFVKREEAAARCRPSAPP